MIEHELVKALKLLIAIKQDCETFAAIDGKPVPMAKISLNRMREIDGILDKYPNLEEKPKPFLDENHRQECQLRYMPAAEAHAKNYGCTCGHADRVGYPNLK